MKYNFIVDENLSGGDRYESLNLIETFFEKNEYTIFMK